MGRLRFALILTLPLMVACKLNVSVKDLEQATNSDYSDTTITVTSPGVADGNTPVTITITVLNHGNPVQNYTPAYAVSGSGNTSGACTATDVNGVSTCLLRSTVAETKTIALVLPAVNKQTTVVFNIAVPPKPGFTISNGGGLISGGTITAQTSIGLPTTPIVLEDQASPGPTRARAGIHGIFYQP